MGQAIIFTIDKLKANLAIIVIGMLNFIIILAILVTIIFIKFSIVLKFIVIITFIVKQHKKSIDIALIKSFVTAGMLINSRMAKLVKTFIVNLLMVNIVMIVVLIVKKKIIMFTME